MKEERKRLNFLVIIIYAETDRADRGVANQCRGAHEIPAKERLGIKLIAGRLVHFDLLVRLVYIPFDPKIEPVLDGNNVLKTECGIRMRPEVSLKKCLAFC